MGACTQSQAEFKARPGLKPKAKEIKTGDEPIEQIEFELEKKCDPVQNPEVEQIFIGPPIEDIESLKRQYLQGYSKG
jgi:hypothetical protein